jgi:hypothetical protein
LSRGYTAGDRSNTAIAGRADNLTDSIRFTNGRGESVFATAGTDDENFHES